MSIQKGQGFNEYLSNMNEILKKIQETQKQNIVDAAELIAKSIQDNGIVHTFGAGHSALLAADLFFRTGTLAPVHFVYDSSTVGETAVVRASYLERLEGYGEIVYISLRAEKSDCMLVISNSGRNPVGIDFARSAKENGHPVIVVVSLAYSNSVPSRHSSAKRLQDFADVVIDNCGAIGDVCVNVDWLNQGLGAISTVTGSLILHSLMVEAAFALKRRGFDPPVFMSGNLDQGDDFNEEYLKKYWHRIRSW